MTAPLHLVVGAGPVGRAVTHELLARGGRVLVVTRSGSGPEHPDVERVAADAGDADRLTALARGAVAVHNCVNPPYHRWAQDWPPVAAALLAAARGSGAVLATCSNLYVYGLTDAALTPPGMTEDLPLAATGTKGRVRAGMWRDALAEHEAGRVRVTEVRGSDYLGATAASVVGDSVVPRLLAGRTAWILGDPDVRHTFTFVGDVARTLVTAALDERGHGRAWHVPSHPAVTVRELAARFAERLGVPPVGLRRIPGRGLHAAGLVLPVAREFAEVSHQHTRAWHLDSSAARDVLGLEPTPWDDVVDAHLAPYRTRAAA